MVEVFKTDVKWRRQAKTIHAVLLQHFPFIKINFDLNDCDRILRVEGSDFCPHKIVELVNLNGHQCLILD